MPIVSILFSGFILFTIIFLAVRAAISPLVPKKEIDLEDKDFEVYIRLRDIGAFDNMELNDIYNLYQDEKRKTDELTKCKACLDALYKLKEKDYINDEALEEKIALVKNHFKME